MIIYLIKLILILVFNIGVNTYYINSGCNCCCNNTKSGDTGSGGSKSNLSTNPSKGIKSKHGYHKGGMRSENNGNLYPNPAKDTNSLNAAHGNKGKEAGDKKEEEYNNKQIKNENNNTLENENENLEEEEEEEKEENKNEEKKEENIKEEPKEEKKDINNTIVIEFVDNNKIKINSKNLELSPENISECIVHKSFTTRTTFCELDEATYNLFTTDIKITFKKTPAENTFVLFAVKINENEYYLGCCNNGNSVGDNGLFGGSRLNQEIKILGNGCGLNDINHMFSYNTNLGNIVFTKYFDTINVTNMSYMFRKCGKLEELDLSNFNTNNVTNMHAMFSECSSLKELNLSSFNTNKVIDMSYMFSGCSSLTELNLSNLNTNNVTKMHAMFSECLSLKELNLSSFNTNNVTDMSYMFFNCTAVKKLNLSNFNTSNDSYITLMFSGCTALKAENLICKDKNIYDEFKA